MDPFKKLVAVVAVIIFVIFIAAMFRLLYLLATRKELDFASIEMKIYMCGFIVAVGSMLGVAIIAGVMPTRGGSFEIGSNPVAFFLALFKLTVLLLLCVYALGKSIHRKSWILRIRK